MGRQINYYISYNDFLTIAQAAADFGCTIYRREFGLPCGGLEMVTEDCPDYYFHSPEFGGIAFREFDVEGRGQSGRGRDIDYAARANVIEAGFSRPHLDKGRIYRNRLYLAAPLKEQPRSETAERFYGKLARLVKKTAPLTEFESCCVNPAFDGERLKMKEYISAECLELVMKNRLKLG